MKNNLPRQEKRKSVSSKISIVEQDNVVKNNKESNTASSEQIFECNLDGCLKKFRNITRLKIHKTSHPFTCKNCGKTFCEKGNLKIHMRTHTGERPYKCDKIGCNAAYKVYGHLKDHTSSKHLNLKPNLCELCKKGFFRKSQLKTHAKRHENNDTNNIKFYLRRGLGNKLIFHKSHHERHKNPLIIDEGNDCEDKRIQLHETNFLPYHPAESGINYSNVNLPTNSLLNTGMNMCVCRHSSISPNVEIELNTLNEADELNMDCEDGIHDDLFHLVNDYRVDNLKSNSVA